MRGLICLASALALVLLTGSPAGALPITWGLGAGLAAGIADWNGNPAGANDWTCRPSAAHPRPVVLVPSTFTSISMDYSALSPYLRDQGYCVYSLNYGQRPYVWPGLVGLAATTESVNELSSFVDKVIASSGSSTVDLVGHSQGGIMVRYYTQVLGGAAKVRTVVTLGSPYRLDAGFNYASLLYRGVHLLPGADQVLAQLAKLTLPGLVGLTDSRFWAALNAGGGISPGTDYLSLGSRTDQIPPELLRYPEAPNTATRFVQDTCPLDAIGHFGLPHDPNVAALVANGLDPAHAQPVRCQVVAPSA
ncbi:triacylglycerol esterase/lipase EstA (alpha/beta hydrolase family) [Kutzneria viridogrisea]|uniref:Triacylglycerol esterase/lipase EstA (Alpha/beta hydrolase family) n=1 Tax=Kutzneria viridogrisea TaxID=47990 RepID=A0ABR6BDK9_9PSEU|nr:triacylglycerol esterase/lipase EstA (alpha/beta hydrolase family) [Kutzneria viridogrisea]